MIGISDRKLQAQPIDIPYRKRFAANLGHLLPVGVAALGVLTLLPLYSPAAYSIPRVLVQFGRESIPVGDVVENIPAIETLVPTTGL